MGTRSIDTNTLVSGYTNRGWFNGRRALVFRQRANLVHASAFFALALALPARSRVVWGELTVNATVVATGSGVATNLANVYGLLLHPGAPTASATLTQPQAATVTVSNGNGGTNGFMMFKSTDLTTNATSMPRGLPLLFGTNSTSIPHQPGTVGALMSLQPCCGTDGYQANGTSGYIFGTSTTTSTNTAGQIDVTLYYEEYDQAPFA